MLLNDGTSGRTRTATPVKAMDFESIVSTNFTTLALIAVWLSDKCRLCIVQTTLRRESASPSRSSLACPVSGAQRLYQLPLSMQSTDSP